MPPGSPSQIFTRHDRIFERNRFVYPVISRRSGGLSIGINLNPDKICNFGCIYCQVDRKLPGSTRFVDLEQLRRELAELLQAAVRGDLIRHPLFANVPPGQQRLKDLAFSGDGEPTSHRNFDEVVAACAEIKRLLAPEGVKMVLITNASLLDRPHVVRALEILDRHQGEIWAKLDAGTEAYFRRVNQSRFTLQRIVDNIAQTAQRRPIVIQSLFFRLEGEPPGPAELEAYCDRLQTILAAGGQLKAVQVYTVARPPAEPMVGALRDREVDAIAARVRQCTGIPTVAYYGCEFP